MGRRGHRKKNREPITVKLERLQPKGAEGEDDAGRTWRVWAAPVGAVVSAWPGRKQSARRIGIETPSADAVAPACSLFGVCGGCQYQEMPLERQRAEKQAMVERLVGHASRPIRGDGAGYGYRNKLELSFGVRRFLPDDERDAPSEGDWLGFHPPGWFSKIVPVPQCPLASSGINAALEDVHDASLGPAWDNQAHCGQWRHVVLREGHHVVVNLVTHPSVDPASVERVADRLLARDEVGGVVWTTTDRLSDVASGDTQRTWGDPLVRLEMAGVQLALPHDAFFQVNTEGARVLFETVAEALGEPGDATLLDLYCGVGAIGLIVGQGHREILGVEVVDSAVQIAAGNAKANGISGRWIAGKVEDVLADLPLKGARHVVVDPPRAGLHPKVARFLSTYDAERLVYVACSPTSLARDRELLEDGGWRLDQLWTIDLFPQTPHVEAVARFVRPPTL